MHIILALDVDLSLTTGYSINERESTLALLDRFPGQISAVVPSPQFPAEFRDERIHYVHNHRRHHPIHYPLFLAALTRAVDRELSCHPRDAVVVFRLGLVPFTAYRLIRRGTPVILKKLAGYSLFISGSRRLPMRVVARIARPLHERVIRGCLGADIESRAYGPWLSKEFGIAEAKMRVVPNGVNIRKFSPCDRTQARREFHLDRFRRVLGYVGALDELRGVDLLIKALPLLSNMPDLGLVLVGRGPSREALEAQAATLGVRDKVVFTGMIPYDDVPRLMSAFDAAVDLTRVRLPIGDSEAIGSFSQKIPQYLACGLPVVAFDTLDTSFLEQEQVGRLLRDDTKEALAAAVRDVLAIAGDVAIKQRTRQYAERHFSAKALADERMEFWHQLTSSMPDKDMER